MFYTGGVICVASSELACASFRVSLISHGSNREDVSGYTKDAYRHATNKLGYDNNDADFVYNMVDLGLSGYGPGKQVLPPDAWKLHRHINHNYTYGWKLMSKTELMAEGTVNASIAYSLYQLTGAN